MAEAQHPTRGPVASCDDKRNTLCANFSNPRTDGEAEYGFRDLAESGTCILAKGGMECLTLGSGRSCLQPHLELLPSVHLAVPLCALVWLKTNLAIYVSWGSWIIRLVIG